MSNETRPITTDNAVERFRSMSYIVVFRLLIAVSDTPDIDLRKCMYLIILMSSIYMTRHASLYLPYSEQANAKGIKTNEMKGAHKPVCSESSKGNINRNCKSAPGLRRPSTQFDPGSQYQSRADQSGCRRPRLRRDVSAAISSLQSTSNWSKKVVSVRLFKIEVFSNLRSSQRRKRDRRKRHAQPRPDHVQIRRQTRNASRDQTLESTVDDAVEDGEGVEAADAGDGKPGPGNNGYANEDWSDGVEGAEFVGEEWRDDSER
jgi:hypothetical protein